MKQSERRRLRRENKAYNKKTHKKCIKCRIWKARIDILAGDPPNDVVTEKHGFGKHRDSSDGLQSICFMCKNVMNNKARQKNVRARLRHHTATRCLTQLGKPLTPKNFVTNLEDYLGYRIAKLVKHLSQDLKAREGPKRKLRDALDEGYHIDHIHPLSRFPVVRELSEPSASSRIVAMDDTADGKYVDWEAFKECWAITNLTAIPAKENLQKGAKIT